YSIDEVFIDATNYLETYRLTASELAMKIILDVLNTTGITATAGIGTNLYLCKIAMDIWAKHIKADKNGVRIAELDEMSYRRYLWNHRPLTDFWRVGKGYAKKLEEHGLYTMGDIARCSIGPSYQFYNEDLLYKLFGINAELLIDHAWGWEPCTIADIKAFKPSTNSISLGQVLQCPYDFEKARLVVTEMTDILVLQLVEKQLVTDQMVLTVGYDIENKSYKGETTTDRYGRKIPKQAHGSINLGKQTSSTKRITNAVLELFDHIVNKNLLVRRMYVVANHVVDESSVQTAKYEQLDLFTDYAALEKQEAEGKAALQKEKKIQNALIDIKNKHGKNAILKGMNLKEGATAKEQNKKIGGHKA
ncbi:MAG: DNA methylase, partial [Ruminococcus sp.]|nr:DNA methylase [Ruminococcus sp.]